MHRTPHVFGISDPRGGKLASWVTTLAMAAIVIGATVALVMVNYVPGNDFQVIVGR
jgi:hypothetical protein